MAAMTDMVMMILILGAGYYAYSTGMLDQLVEQVKGMGGGAAPETAAPEEAKPAEGGAEEAKPAEDSGSEGGDKGGDSGGDKKKKKSSSDYAISTYSIVPINWK